MKLTRNIFFHFAILSFVALLNLASLWVYKHNPQAREIIQSVNKGLTWEAMVHQSITGVIVSVIIIYTFFYILFNLIFKNQLTLQRGLLTILVFFVLVTIQIYAMQFQKGMPFSFKPFLNVSASTLFIGGIGLGFRGILEFFNNKEQKKELEKKNLESELNLLRSQINPHFLFNTLNNIDALIRKDPEKASDLLVKLSVQMRYMLYDSNTNKIDFDSEIKFIKDYIALQQLRLKNPEAIQFEIINNHAERMVPPMLFIPFIENAFKHCSDFNQPCSVKLTIENEPNTLKFYSTNQYLPNNEQVKDKTGGIGLELVKKRLALLYPGKHALEIKTDNGQFTVNLQIFTHED